jgi:signal transduction histidine kinase
MKRPWQIWLLFGLGLAVVVPAMAWLTVKALELDRAESLARQQAELEEDVSRALWRMDLLLTPLLAEEAARPDFVYRPAYLVESDAGATELKPGGKGTKEPAQHQELSPLLLAPPQYVLVHFEVHPDGSITSPQNPTGDFNTLALGNGISPAAISTAATRLDELRPSLQRDTLLAMLPQQTLPTTAWYDARTEPGTLASNTAPANPIISNNYDDLGPQILQQDYAPPQSPSSYLFNSPGQQGGNQSYEIPTSPNSADANPNADVPQAVSPQVAGQQPGNQGAPFRDDSQAALPPPVQQQVAYGANIESGRSQRIGSRSGNDLPNRSAVVQREAGRSYAQQRSNFKSIAPTVRVVEGVSRPLWLGDRLVLARRVQIGDEVVIQGCWLDWPALKTQLTAEVADLLPQVELTPISASEPIKLSRLLATIPVQLSVPAPVVASSAWSPIRVSLVVAWLCLLLTAAAAAIMLQSIITLSERRGAFVSAVTHELRTPLTTFRMYAEMLSEGMVPDAEQRQKYLNTLRVEADRLSHLVENVLQYARLERSRSGKRREPVALAALVDHCHARLADRAAQADMKLLVEWNEAAGTATIPTDLAAVEQILFNLVDNACKYASAASDKRLHLRIDVKPRTVTIGLADHGPGISAAGRKRLFQPFSKSVHEAATSAPGVGLGLALCRRLAIDLGGKLELLSPDGGGALFVLTLPR